MTRRQLSRHEREQRQRTALFAGLAVVLLLVVAIPAVGYYREVLTKGSQPIAVADGHPILLEDYAKLLGWRQALLDGQIQQVQQLASQSARPSASGTPQANPFQQQLEELQQQRDDLDNAIVDQMVQNQLMADEAAKRGIEVTKADEDKYIADQFGSPAAPTPAATATIGAAAAVATPAVSPTIAYTPAPTADPIQRLTTTLGNVKVMNEADYRALVARPAVLEQKLRDQFAADVPKTEPEIHARHILVDTEDKAKEAKARLDKGEAFEKVAADMSTDTSNKDKGGDLGWFGKGKMVSQFEDAAFKMQPGQISDPVRTGFGWHIIQVLERDDNHPVDDARRQELADKAFADWITKAKDDGFTNGTVQYFTSADKFTWAHNQIAKARGLPRGAA
jgi:parvulin-like peptidyl-prolyl isomerase